MKRVSLILPFAACSVLLSAAVVTMRADPVEYGYVFQEDSGYPQGFGGEIFFFEPINPVVIRPLPPGYSIGLSDSVDSGNNTVTTFGTLADIDLNRSFLTFPDGTANFADSDVQLKGNLKWNSSLITSMDFTGDFFLPGGSEKITWSINPGDVTGQLQTPNPDGVSYDIATNYDPPGLWKFDPASTNPVPDEGSTVSLLALAVLGLGLLSFSRVPRKVPE